MINTHSLIAHGRFQTYSHFDGILRICKKKKVKLENPEVQHFLFPDSHISLDLHQTFGLTQTTAISFFGIIYQDDSK